MKTINISSLMLAAGATHIGGGKVNAPVTQAFAESLAEQAVVAVGGPWQPGQPKPGPVTVTGAGPAWAYMVVAHALHGLVSVLIYSAPNAEIQIYGHGFAAAAPSACPCAAQHYWHIHPNGMSECVHCGENM